MNLLDRDQAHTFYPLNGFDYMMIKMILLSILTGQVLLMMVMMMI